MARLVYSMSDWPDGCRLHLLGCEVSDRRQCFQCLVLRRRFDSCNSNRSLRFHGRATGAGSPSGAGRRAKLLLPECVIRVVDQTVVVGVASLAGRHARARELRQTV